MHVIKPVSDQLSVFSIFVADGLSNLARKAYTLAKSILILEKMPEIGPLSRLALRSNAFLFLAAGAISLIAYFTLFRSKGAVPKPIVDKPPEPQKNDEIAPKTTSQETPPSPSFKKSSRRNPFSSLKPPHAPTPPNFGPPSSPERASSSSRPSRETSPVPTEPSPLRERSQSVSSRGESPPPNHQKIPSEQRRRVSLSPDP